MLLVNHIIGGCYKSVLNLFAPITWHLKLRQTTPDIYLVLTDGVATFLSTIL